MSYVTSGDFFNDVRVEPATPDGFGKGQRAHPLGVKFMVAAMGTDRTLFWVKADGTIAGGPHHKQDAQPTDIEVIHAAHSGHQVWEYVKNVSGGVIERGQGVKIATTRSTPSASEVEPTNAVDDYLVGIAQFDIPDEGCAWVVCEGVCTALADAGSVVVDQVLLKLAAGGDFTNAATTDITNAQLLALESIAQGALGLVRILSH